MNGFEEEYLTVAEIAERLKLNPQTLRNWIDQGHLPAVRVGRRVRIRRSDFEHLVQAGYSGRSRPNTAAQEQGPTGEDFWSGEAASIAQPARQDSDEPEATT